MKHLKKLWCAALLCMLFCLTTSCGGYDDSRAQELIDKYKSTGQLSHKEYGELIDMSADAMEHSISVYTQLAERSDRMSAGEYRNAFSQMKNDILDKYVYMNDIIDILSSSKEAMGEDNYNQWMAENHKFSRNIKRISEKIKNKYNE